MLERQKAIVGRKVRFALVGCGRISANHIAAISEHKTECELIAVCDSGPNLEAAVTKTGAKGYNDLTDMLEAITDFNCSTPIIATK